MIGIRKANVHEHRLPTAGHDFLVEHFSQKILQLLEVAVAVDPSTVADLFAEPLQQWPGNLQGVRSFGVLD